MPSFDRRDFMRLTGTAAATSVLASACSGSSLGDNANDRRGPIKIGLILPESGVYVKLGADQRNGWELFLKLNGRKLGGRDVEVITADEGSGQDPKTTKASAERLLKREQVDVACGIISSSSLIAVQEMFTEAKVPLISTNAGATEVLDKEFGWRTSFVNNHAGVALGEYIAKNAGGSVAVIAADYPAGHDFVAGMQKRFKPAGGKTAGEPIMTPFPIGGKSFEPYLQQILQRNPKAVFAFYAGADAVKFVKEYDKFGLSKKYQMFAPGFLTEGGVLAAEGESANGIMTSMHYSPDLDNAPNRRFVAEYQKTYNASPSCYAVAAYDAGWVLDRSIEACGDDLTSERLEEEIGEVGEIDSPRGPWTFGKNRSPVQNWYLRQVRQDGDVLANVVIDELGTLGDRA